MNNMAWFTLANTNRRKTFNTRFEQIQSERNDYLISRKIAKRESHFELQRKIECKERKTELDPFTLIPVEMWNMVFAQLTDTADLLRCMETYTRFENMLFETRTKFLFAQVLPFLADDLSARDILKCRMVCKKWCSSVDKVLESLHNFYHRESIHEDLPYLKPFNGIPPSFFTYTFTIPLNDGLQNETSIMQRDAMKLHSRNPLLGRNVRIQVTLRNPDERQRDDMGRMVESVFSDFGTHLFHVELSVDHSQFQPRQYFNLICNMLNVCTNLKILRLLTFIREGNPNFNIDGLRFSIYDIPLCRNLEVLQLYGNWRPGHAIRRALIRKYSNQLRFLDAWYWNVGIYEGQNLTCLELRGVGTDLEVIENMEAPRLKNICLRFHEFMTPRFPKVLNVLNRFPALTTCTLKFQRVAFGFCDYQFLKTEHISELVSSKTITCLNLHLETNRECTLSFDLLIFFPFLERLSITIEEWIWETPLRSFTSGNRRNDFVQLAQYISDVSLNKKDPIMKPIYRSNIWQLLTRLKLLKVEREMHNPRGNRKNVVVYTRNAYEDSLRRRSTSSFNKFTTWIENLLK